MNQYKIINWKNWIVIKRNPGELAMDILYPILFLAIIFGISTGVHNEEKEGTLVYDNTLVAPEMVIPYFNKDSVVVFMPVPNSDCQNPEFFPLIDSFNNTVRASGGAPTIFCIESEEMLTKWILEKDILVAFDFDDPSSILDVSKDVHYTIRPKSDFFTLVNYEPFVDTYRQQPSTQPDSFKPFFTPLQQFMDSLIEKVKIQLTSSHSAWFKQFPNLNYYLDTRLSNLQGMFPIYIILVISFPMATISRRLLEERDARVQEAMLMTGLDEVVWYMTWYWTIFARSLIVCLAAAICCSFVCSKTNFFMQFLIFLIVSFSCSSYSMALTSLFDKAETGSGVILLILIFGGLPAMFLTKLNTWWYVLFSFVLPPTSMVEVANILLFSDSVYKAGVPLSRLFDPSITALNVNLGIILLSLLIAGFGYIFFGFYINKVIKHRYGKKEDCCYCVKHNKTIPTEVDGEEEDVILSDSIEPVEKEVAQRDGVFIHHLSKSFPPSKKGGEPTVAVNDFSAAFYEGQITVLLGHNGAGKSTLINVLTGLYNATSGDAMIYGHSLNNQLGLIRKDLGVCPQQNLMISVLTCREHLMLFARLRNVPEEEIPKLVEDALTDIGMLDKADAQVKTLSGGMKRRLNVAMALIGDPRIVFLDEPTSGMDPTSRRQIWSVLEKKKEGRVIVLCTHFMDEADFLGDRILVMSKGTLQVAGSSLFLKSKYGLGYHIHIAKEQDAHDEAISTVIKKYIPDAIIEESSHLSIQFMVPRTATPVFSSLLQDLNDQKSSLHISDTGVSATTLEEVFVNLAAEAELEEAKALEKAPAEQEKKKDEKDESLPVTTADTKKEVPVPSSPVSIATSATSEAMEFPVVELIDSSSSQFSILMWKKWLMGIRQKKELLQEVVFPLYCIVIGILFLFLGSFLVGIETTESLSFPPSILEDPTNHTLSLPYFYQTAQEKAYLETYLHHLPQSTNYTLPTLVDASSLITEFTDKAKANYLLETGYNVIAMDVLTTGDTPRLRIWYNTSYSGVLPAMTNLLDSAIMNTRLGGSSMSVSSSYRVLPQSSATPAILSVIFVIVFCLYVSEGLNMLPAYAGVSVARERISQARLQQRLMGVNDVLYWLSTFLFDFLLVLPSLIVFFIVAYFFAQGLRPAALAMCAVICAFIWCALPLCYLLSFKFKSASTAEQGILNVLMITMLLSVCLSSLLSLVPFLQEYEKIISYLLYLAPGYAFFDTFRIVGSYFPQYDLLGITPPNPWSFEYCGKGLIFMFIEGVVFFVWVIIQERHEWVKNQKVEYESTVYEPEDEDVKNEIQRVQQNLTKSHDETPSTEAITFNHIWKVYAGSKKTPPVEACRDVTFGVTRGDCFGLLGPNGAGKTSLLSILMGTLGYNEGSCKVFEEPIPAHMQLAYELLGYCPQFDVLFDFMTTYECLYFYGCIKGIPKNEMESVISQILQCLGLTEHRDKYTRDLSGGNKRRLCVAIAFMGNPQIVVMDEPSTGLDPVSRRKLWNIIKTSSISRSFLLTTHLMEEADALCNRIAIMVNGQIKCIGSSQHLKSKFGDGYNLDFKLIANSQKMDEFQNYLKQEVGNFEIRECYANHAILVLPTSKSLSYLFKLMEENKDKFEIQDYTLSQTTLDQVFLQFAKGQREETVTYSQAELMKTS